ncbi:hypothetical protein L0U85_03235 [Glycomyces sp. L485]|uniref:hypothetical protein n=1 Tax=Glycomyces sp. L485 TaxID=2909235 RepID=UPI001F4B51B1|nr:hypothetical protein [Glycomyces sp. L485]MCH7229876.1 hypothetical protein [Glycomyces sp. L485]
MPLSCKSLTTLAPLAAVMLSATACAEIEPLETTGVYEIFTGSSENPWCGREDEAWLGDAGADLMGAHFAVTMLCQFAVDEVPEHMAEQTERLADLPLLVDGAELLINQLALTPTHQPEDGGGPLEVWVEAGDRRIDLKALPPRGGFVAVSVRAGEDAVLWVEDDGRAQGLDFRTGEQVDPVLAYYNEVELGAFELDGYEYEDVLMRSSESIWHTTCTSPWGEVTRGVWNEDRGWATEGTVFIVVAFRWCGSESSFEGKASWLLDLERAVRVSDGDSTYAPVDWTKRNATGNAVMEKTVFEVPAEATGVTVEFVPVGDMHDNQRDEGLTLVDSLEVTVWEVNF